MKPMLAATIKDVADVQYPVYASPKLDGIRGVVFDGALHSRSLKAIPNPFVSARFSKAKYNGFDGELVLGSPTAKDVYRQSNGACARHEGKPDVKLWVFDNFIRPGKFSTRWIDFIGEDDQLSEDVIILHQWKIENEKELLKTEEFCLEKGYEGLILRSPDGLYKYGRSTMSQQGMMKLKRFTDSEAVILEVIEERKNTNEKKTNELGRSKRSSHAAGKIGKGTAGGFKVRDIKSGVEFDIGSGLTDADGTWFWSHKAKIEKSGDYVIKYKSFQIGVKDKPRHPVYLGPREDWDLS